SDGLAMGLKQRGGAANEVADVRRKHRFPSSCTARVCKDVARTHVGQWIGHGIAQLLLKGVHEADTRYVNVDRNQSTSPCLSPLSLRHRPLLRRPTPSAN